MPPNRAVIALAFAAVVVLAGSADAAPEIILEPAMGTTGSVRIAGRVRATKPHGSTPLSRNIRRLTVDDWVGAPLELAFVGQVAKTITLDDGEFEVVFTAPRGRPFPVGRAEVHAKVPGATASGPVEIIADDTPFLVVSDFDDTVAISQVTSRRGLAGSALLQDADTHPPVPGMAVFYRCLRAPRPFAPGLVFVSGSPTQFVPRVRTFLERNGFPFAGMDLRDLGPTTLADYKQPIIRRILTRFPQPVILIGDSGEADPEVYAQIRREFPGRVARIYIRDAGGATDPERFDEMLLFRNAREAIDDALRRGYVEKGCIDREASTAPKQASPKGPAPTPSPSER